MTMTKKKKRILLFSILAGVVVIAAAVAAAVWLLSPKTEESAMTLAVKADNNYDPDQTVYIVLNGFDGQEEYPGTLPLYSFAMPEGYTHTVNAETSANRFATGYTDEYQTPEGGTLEFYQALASSNWRFSREGEFQEMTFGGTRVVCYHGEDFYGQKNSAVFWLHGDSVLTFSADWAMEDNELLGLVSRVDYEAVRQPIYSPWEFHWGSFTIETGENGYTNYSTRRYEITGNPQLPEEILFYGCNQPPEGFVKSQLFSQANSSYRSRMESYYRDTDAGRETLEIFCTTWPIQVFRDMPEKELNDHSLVQELTVGGHPGWYYQSETVAELVFLDDYRIVDITFQGQTTQQELLELGESLIEVPGE